MASKLTREIDESPAGPRVAAFFDLDRTLIAGFSGIAFTRHLVRSGRLRSAGLGRTALAAARLGTGRGGFSGLIASFAAALAGMREREFEKLGEEIFVGSIAARVFPEARALVRAHLKRKHTVAFVSSALRYQIDPLARDLGVKHVLCTRLEVKNGKLTGEVLRPACWGEGKALAMRDLAKAKRLDLSRSWFYGDSGSDVAALEIVGNPRPTNPQPKLASIAAARGWPVRNFSSRGIPSAADVVRTALALGSFGPAVATALPALALNRSTRPAVNAALAAWGELGTALAGVKLRIEGEEHLWSQRPAVFVFNHQSAIEALLVCKLLRRDFVGIGKSEIQRVPLIGRIFEAFGTVFVDRSDPARAIESLAPVVDAIREGYSVAIAPEGTRSPTPTLGRFKKGAFHLAMQARVPVVPIVFRNTLDALPKRGFVIRPATIEVVVHPPISTKHWRVATLEKHVDDVRRKFLVTLDR